MPRSRDLRPGFFRNEYLAELPPLARILFEGLWCLADKEGRLEDRPKRIKMEILPYDECDVDCFLDLLMNAKEQFILRYEVGGKNFIQITNFKKNQNIHPKEAESLIPPPFQESREKPGKIAEENGKPGNFANGVYTEGIEVLEETEVQEKDGGMGEGEEPLKSELPYKEIIDHLNQKAGTKYRYTTPSTQTFIRARLAENFTVEDFKTIIDKKCLEWLNTDQEQYLRPETLFCPKHFESYLNQKVNPSSPNKPPGKPTQSGNFEQTKYGKGELDKFYKEV